jgi:uncharacterized protein (TIGR04255 family)
LRVASSLSEQFSIFEATRERTIAITPEGVKEADDSGTPIWRLRSDDDNWQVSFSSQFLSLETSKYSGRTDFIRRLKVVLDAYQSQVKPPSAIRIGVRYTNRISESEDLQKIGELVRKELLGPTATKLPSQARLGHSISNAQFESGSGGSLLNWGLLGSRGVFDLMIPPLDKPSWLLDIDVFDTDRVPFDAPRLSELAEGLAKRAYTHFRWAVTEEFLKTYGGR